MHNSHAKASCGWDIVRSRTTQVPTPNIRQLSILRQHSGIGSNIANIASESTKVRVAVDIRDPIEVFGGRVEEGLGIR